MHAMPLLSWSTFKSPQQGLGGNYLLSEFAWSNLNSFTRSGPCACPTVCTRIRCISESFRPVFLLLLFLGLPLRPGRPETIPHEPALRYRLAASNVSPSLPSLPCPRSGLPAAGCPCPCPWPTASSGSPSFTSLHSLRTHCASEHCRDTEM